MNLMSIGFLFSNKSKYFEQLIFSRNVNRAYLEDYQQFLDSFNKKFEM